jgi:ABC-2 type transport system permease protein
MTTTTLPPAPETALPAPSPDTRGRARAASVVAAVWALYVLTLRQHLHGKRWMVTAALFLLPIALAVFARVTAPDASGLALEFVLAFMFIPQGLLPLVTLLFASGVIADEQEEQTITYLLMRPIPKWALYAVKVLATLTTTVTLTVLFTVLTYAAIYAGAGRAPAGEDVVERCVRAAAIHGLAATAYCSLFGLISLLTRRTLVLGIIYAVIFEGLLANLPLSVRMITVIYYARVIAYRSMGFVVDEGPAGLVNIGAEAWQFDVVNDPKLLEHPTAAAAVAVLLCASVAFIALGSFLCWRREFHVKTPGGQG